MKKINIGHGQIKYTERLGSSEKLQGDFYFGARNIFFPFKESNRGFKVFLRNHNDPHRVIDQAFPDPPYHYDNPDAEIVPLNYGEFGLMKSINEFFANRGLGPKVYDEVKIRINSLNHYALIIEDLGRYPNPSKEETFETRDMLNDYLMSNNYFINEWEDEEPSNYFKTPNRGILAVDYDWGLIVHNKIDKSLFGYSGLSLENKDISSEIALGTICINIDNEFRSIVSDIVLPNFKEYAWKHNYDFYTLMDKINIDFENNAFKESGCYTLYKIVMIERLLDKGYEYVAIIDSFDALITNKSIPLEKFIDSENSIFLSPDVNGWNLEVAKNTASINTGFAIYKNDQFTRDFLKKVKSINVEWDENSRRTMNDQVLFQMVLKNDRTLWEKISLGDPLQQGFWFYNKPNFKKNHASLYKQHESPYIWKDGDFMIHFAGQPNSNELLKEFNDYLNSSNKM